jgi:hypothetical protein
MRITLTRLIVALVAALSVIVAPAGAATWEPPVRLSQPYADTDGLQLVAGSDGRVLVVWSFRSASGLSGVEAVSRRPDGRWGPRRALGAVLPVSGAPSRISGAGSVLSGMSAFGANRWLGLSLEQRGRQQALAWWKGTTVGAAHRGGAFAEEPWAAGPVAAFSNGDAVVAWTTMRPRRGAGSNLRPRVVVVARGSDRGFGPSHRISPLPPGPPYGGGLGPALSATIIATAAGGRGTVVVAWQRVGRIEARISRDRGQTYGPVRYLGPSNESFPLIAASVSKAGRVLVVWGGRERQGLVQSLVYRAAIASPRGAFATREIERSAPLSVAAPVADQYGPRAVAGFDGETPLAAWQTAVDGRSAVRTARLSGNPMTATFGAPADQNAVLDDLTQSRSGSAAVAWHTVGTFGAPADGFLAQAPPGGPFDDVQSLPMAGGVTEIRLAFNPHGLLASWSRSAADQSSSVLAAELR